ncbi:putative pyridine nucleotide-disulfide oxidoreductase [Escherichia coli]|uniref:Putative pyridine nucleotide-disulfide oxidoreductase n=1 Tax=Escherichia coli TaxID=562 RepID=A0A376X4A0_ECOLX|nr:putative pyridine nucleotide-disulfide oxidoreductase [Escherichia coli]
MRDLYNIGCIPTKTLVHDAQQHTDFVRAIQRKNEVVNFLRNKNFHNLADMPNIDVIDGQAEFINNHSLRVHRPEGNLEIHGEKILLIPVHKPWFRQFLELPPRQEYMTAPDYLI